MAAVGGKEVFKSLVVSLLLSCYFKTMATCYSSMSTQGKDCRHISWFLHY